MLLTIFASMALSSTLALADSGCGTGPAHTVHLISVNQNATCTLTKLYEADRFCLSDMSGKEITAPFQVTPNQDFNFEMRLKGADFNMEFNITCVSNDGRFAQSPKAMFEVGANWIADPQVEVNALYDAQAKFVPATKENPKLQFYINFPEFSEKMK